MSEHRMSTRKRTDQVEQIDYWFELVLSDAPGTDPLWDRSDSVKEE